MTPARRAERGDYGQATVEFALVIPLVVVALMAIVQVALVAYSQLIVTHVARETARNVAVDPAADIRQMTENRSLPGGDELIIDIHFESSEASGRDVVVVAVRFQVAPVIGLFAPFSERFEVREQVQMLREW